MNRQKLTIGIFLIIVLVVGVVFMVLNKDTPTKKNNHDTGIMTASEESSVNSATETTIEMETTKNQVKSQEGILGTWKYKGPDYDEYISFGSEGDYGYLAVPVDGTEQSFTGKYQVSGSIVGIYANDEEQEFSFQVKGEHMILGDKTYKKFLEEGSEEE